MNAKITVSSIVGCGCGAAWLWFCVPTLHTPFPADWTAIPVAMAVLLLAFIALTGGKVEQG